MRPRALPAVLDVVEYVVLKRLAGEAEALRAIEMYFVRGMSPGEIAEALGVSREQVKRWVHRVTDHWPWGNSPSLRRVVALALELTEGIEPIVEAVDGGMVCRLCGYIRTRRPRMHAPMHVAAAHRDLVRRLAEEAVRRVWRSPSG